MEPLTNHGPPLLLSPVRRKARCRTAKPPESDDVIESRQFRHVRRCSALWIHWRPSAYSTAAWWKRRSIDHLLAHSQPIATSSAESKKLTACSLAAAATVTVPGLPRISSTCSGRRKLPLLIFHFPFLHLSCCFFLSLTPPYPPPRSLVPRERETPSFPHPTFSGPINLPPEEIQPTEIHYVGSLLSTRPTSVRRLTCSIIPAL